MSASSRRSSSLFIADILAGCRRGNLLAAGTEDIDDNSIFERLGFVRHVRWDNDNVAPPHDGLGVSYNQPELAVYHNHDLFVRVAVTRSHGSPC